MYVEDCGIKNRESPVEILPHKLHNELKPKYHLTHLSSFPRRAKSGYSSVLPALDNSDNYSRLFIFYHLKERGLYMSNFNWAYR